jgi:carbamate kinase
MRIVAALGGNALLRRGEPLTDAAQRANVRRAAEALAPICAAGHEVVITHGNGPQVGLLALQSAAGPASGQQALDVLNAESEGMLGYLIEQEIRNVLPGRQVASLLTQVVVDPRDPAFLHPSKPIGPLYPEPEARRLAAERGWAIVRDGASWRRAVASPRPLSILAIDVIADLSSRGVIVICVGGGGIPVSRGDDGRISGVEAVIDKDAASALLACNMAADRLLLLTDVAAVFRDWRTPGQAPIRAAEPDDIDLAGLEAGSMRPKVEAAASFARRTGKPAVIGRLEDAVALLAGDAGTTITVCRGAACDEGDA